MSDARGRFRGALLGLAAGDALGAAVEFKVRGTFAPLVESSCAATRSIEP